MQVILIAAQSLDGFITQHDHAGSDFTSDADKKHFRNVLREFDCRIMGSRTYEVTREGVQASAAKGRFNAVLTSRPTEYAAESVSGRVEFIAQQPKALLADLKQRGFEACALIGGSKIHASFLGAQLVNELWITVEPRLFGCGTPLVGAQTDVRMKLIGNENLAPDTLLLKYRVEHQ